MFASLPFLETETGFRSMFKGNIPSYPGDMNTDASILPNLTSMQQELPKNDISQ
jgi:hypothetical protein